MVSKYNHLRRQQLIDELKDTYSKSNVELHLIKLVKSGTLIKAKGPEKLKKYGIPDTHKNASYYLLKKSSILKNHFEQVIDDLNSDNENDKKDAVKEIKLYHEKYNLNKLEFDSMLNSLFEKDNTFDDKSIDTLIKVIYDCIITKKMEPNSRYSLVEWLNSLLDKYPVKHKSHPNLRTNIIHVLGFFNSSEVIKELEKDAESLEDLSSVEDDYLFPFPSKVFEEYINKLYTLEKKLRHQDNKINSANCIEKIRYGIPSV